MLGPIHSSVDLVRNNGEVVASCNIENVLQMLSCKVGTAGI